MKISQWGVPLFFGVSDCDDVTIAFVFIPRQNIILMMLQ